MAYLCPHPSTQDPLSRSDHWRSTPNNRVSTLSFSTRDFVGGSFLPRPVCPFSPPGSCKGPWVPEISGKFPPPRCFCLSLSGVSSYLLPAPDPVCSFSFHKGPPPLLSPFSAGTYTGASRRLKTLLHSFLYLFRASPLLLHLCGPCLSLPAYPSLYQTTGLPFRPSSVPDQRRNYNPVGPTTDLRHLKRTRGEVNPGRTVPGVHGSLSTRSRPEMVPRVSSERETQRSWTVV